MSLEDKIDKLTAAVTKNNALLEASMKSGAPTTSGKATTGKAEKPETAAAKKKRLAAEKAAEKAAKEAAEGPADLATFKKTLLAKVKGRPDAAPFTKEFLSEQGFAAAAEVPEEEWQSTLEAYDVYIAEKGEGTEEI